MVICLFANTVKTDSSSENKIKICILFGSARRDGNTAKLLDAFFEGVGDNIEFSTFSAFELNAMPCENCSCCKTREACIKCDLDDFYKSFEQADIFVLATPVYLMNFPSPVKAVLDRFQRYYNARFFLKKRQPIEKPRRAFFFAVSGSDDTESFNYMEKQLITCFSVMNTRVTETFFAGGLDEFNIESYISQIKKLSESIFG